MGLRRYIYHLYNFYLGSALVRDDFTADLKLVRNTILRVGVGWGGGGGVEEVVGWDGVEEVYLSLIFFKS